MTYVLLNFRHREKTSPLPPNRGIWLPRRFLPRKCWCDLLAFVLFWRRPENNAHRLGSPRQVAFIFSIVQNSLILLFARPKTFFDVFVIFCQGDGGECSAPSPAEGENWYLWGKVFVLHWGTKQTVTQKRDCAAWHASCPRCECPHDLLRRLEWRSRETLRNTISDPKSHFMPFAQPSVSVRDIQFS